MKRTMILAGLALVCLTPVAADAAKPPSGSNQLTIDSQASAVTFGRSTVISGRLTGPNHANRTIELQKDPYPFEGNFVEEATTRTGSNGSYSFRVFPTVHTRYRVEARPPSAVTSATVTVLVRKRVSLFANDYTPTAGERVRFFGRTCPEHDGMTVHLQRRTSSGWRHVAHPVLQDELGGPTILGQPCSTYEATFRVSSDRSYRAVVGADADHSRGVSRQRFLDVHR